VAMGQIGYLVPQNVFLVDSVLKIQSSVANDKGAKITKPENYGPQNNNAGSC